jgi:hypothetical protein
LIASLIFVDCLPHQVGLSTPVELGKLFEELTTTLSPTSRIQHLAFEGALMATLMATWMASLMASLMATFIS